MPQAVQVETDGPNRAQRRAKASNERRLRPRFVSIRDACHYLGVSRSHFYAKLFSQVKIVHVGRRTLVDLDSLDDLGDAE